MGVLNRSHLHAKLTSVLLACDLYYRIITESPYSSTAATFYLLAEAELHRRLHKEYSTDSPLKRKLSVPAKFQRIGLSPRYDILSVTVCVVVMLLEG